MAAMDVPSYVEAGVETPLAQQLGAQSARDNKWIHHRPTATVVVLVLCLGALVMWYYPA